MKETTSVRLKRIMEERNLKQVDILRLAEPFCKKYKVKLNKSDLSQFVSGKVVPGQWKLTVLGLALNVSEVWLMGLDVPMERDTDTDSKDNIVESLTDESLAVAYAYQKAAPAVKFSVRKLLDIPEPVIQFGLAARDGEGDVITATKETVDAAAKERQRLLEDDDQPDL